jgi:hypothetical protein
VRQIVSLVQRANTAKVQALQQQLEDVQLDITAPQVRPQRRLLGRLRSVISQLANVLQGMHVQLELPFHVDLASMQTWHRRLAQLARLVGTALDIR